MKANLRTKCSSCGHWNRVPVNKIFIEQPSPEPKVKVLIPMYEPLEVTRCKNCRKIITETKELIIKRIFLHGGIRMSSIYDDMMDSEKQVANYLSELSLYWIYQSPVFVYDEKDRPRVWTPDFYIPKLGIYIEVCGSEDFNYDYRDKIYRKNGIFAVFLHSYKEKGKWKTYLIKKIMEIEEYRHSEVMKMLKLLHV